MNTVFKSTAAVLFFGISVVFALPATADDLLTDNEIFSTSDIDVFELTLTSTGKPCCCRTVATEWDYNSKTKGQGAQKKGYPVTTYAAANKKKAGPLGNQTSTCANGSGDTGVKFINTTAGYRQEVVSCTDRDPAVECKDHTY